MKLIEQANERRALAGLPPLDSPDVGANGMPLRVQLGAEVGIQPPLEVEGRTVGMDAGMCFALAEAAFGQGSVPAAPEDERELAGWAAEMFPGLTDPERLKAVRYVGAFGFLCDETPVCEADADRTVVKRCLAYADLSWVGLVGMKKREDRFAAVVEAAEAARKEAVMDALEARLQGRAFHGQRELISGRSGTAETLKYDNTLAFNLLKGGRGLLGGKGGKAGEKSEDGMTFVMAGGGSKPPAAGERAGGG